MLSQRVSSLQSSPTLALATKAKELKAEGHDVISLSVGEPDWDTFDVAKEAGIQAIKDGKTKYQPAAGIPELRKAIAKQTSEDLGIDYDFQQVTVTTGAKFILFAAIQSLVDPGDEVIVPKPYWVSYPAMVDLAGGVSKFVDCTEENSFKLTANDLRNALSDKTKVVMLNSPSNPTGQVYTESELKELASVLSDFPKAVIISDDIYNRLVFSGELAPHLLKVSPQLKDRTLVVNGVSKSYSMTGWRIGWAVGPQELVAAMARYQSQSVSSSCSISQFAALSAIEKGQEDMKKSLELLQERMSFFQKALAEIPGVEVERPGGAFYLWPKVSSFIGKSFNGSKISSTKDLCNALLEDQKVVAVPGSDFGIEGYMRLSYALSLPRIEEAVQRMKTFFAKLS